MCCLVGWSVGGEGEADGGDGALVERAREMDCAAGFDDDGAGDGEAKAGAAGVAVARWVAAIEAIKYVRQSFGGDAVAVVFNGEGGGVGFCDEAK